MPPLLRRSNYCLGKNVGGVSGKGSSRRRCPNNHRQHDVALGRSSSAELVLSASSSSGAAVSEAADDDDTESGKMLECSEVDADDMLVVGLKKDLFQLGASYNRGFAATSSPLAGERAMQVIRDLERQYDVETFNVGNMQMDVTSPLRGCWRMIWASAFDVLVLESSPIFATGAIHQVYDEDDRVTNVIDFIPRFQSLFPPPGFGMNTLSSGTAAASSSSSSSSKTSPNTVFRANVVARASRQKGEAAQLKPNRVQLDFERVRLEPVQFLGVDVDMWPPRLLAFDLPKVDDLPPFFPVRDDDGNNPGTCTSTSISHLRLFLRRTL